MERWLTQRLSPASARRRAGPTASARTSSSRPRAGSSSDAVAAASGIDPDADPWLPAARGVAAARGRRRAPRRAVAAQPRRRTSATRTTPTAARARFATRPPPRRALRPLRAAPAGAWCARWARGDADAAARAPRGRRSCGGGCARGSAMPEPGRAARAPRASACAAEPGARRPARPRSSLFGLTRLPAGHLEVLRALAAQPRRPPVPPAPVARAVGAGRATPRRRSPRRARGRPTAALADNRLLASWGQDARELQLVLARPARRTPTTTTPRARRADTLLARIQADVRADRRRPARRCPTRRRPPAARPRRPQRPGPRLPRPRPPGRGPARRDPAPARRGPDARAARRDRHVPGHRDVRAADPGDVRRGRGRVEDDELERRCRTTLRPPDLRVRLADRSLRQTNPVLGVVAQLLDLAEQRLTASQVLDLADREPVRRRFRLDDDDLARMRGLGRDSGHPLGPRRRAPRRRSSSTGCPPARGGRAWTACCSASTMTEDEPAAVRRRAAARRRRERRHRPRRAASPSWSTACRHALDAFATAEPIARVGRRDRRPPPTPSPPPPSATPGSARSSQRLLDDVVARGDGAGADATTLALPEVRALLAERLAGPPDARELPHRPPDDLHARADALGAAPGRLPARPRRRRVPAQGARATATTSCSRDPHVGDRDPRTEDRQMLLDALMAASDRPDRHLHGQRRAHEHAAPARGAGRRAARRGRPHGPRRGRRARATRARPRIRCSRSTRATSRPASSAARRLELRPRHARRRPRARRPSAPRRRRSSPARCPPVSTPGGRARGPRRASSATPCARSCASGSASASATYDDEVDDALPIELDDLESVAASASGCSTRRLAGADRTAASAAELARGALPPGGSAEPVIAKLRPTVERDRRLRAALLADGDAAARSTCAVDAAGDGRLLSGTVPDVHGTLLRVVTYSRVTPAAPARAVGALARAHRRAPRPPVPGGDRGPRRAPARGGRRDDRAGCPRSAPTPRSSTSPRCVDLHRRGTARAAPDRLQDLGRLRGGAARRERSGKAATRSGSRSGASPRRTRSPSTSWRSAACSAFDELLRLPARDGEDFDAG